MRKGFVVAVALFLACFAQADDLLGEEPVWSHKVPGKVVSVDVQGELILVGGENGVYSLDNNGILVGFYPTNAAVTSLRRYDGILAAASDGSLTKLDLSGNLLWERQLPGYIGYDDAVDSSEKGILCGSMDGFIYMLSDDGTFRWKHLVGSYVTNVRLLNDTAVAVSDRQVYILDLEGRVRRNLNIIGYIRSADVSDDTIVVGMDDGDVRAYGLNGELYWRMNTSSHVSAITARGNVTVGTRDGRVIRLGRDGTLLWSRNATAGVAAIEDSDGALVVATLDNAVTAYTSSGTPQMTFKADGRMYALASDGQRLIAGTTTGAVNYYKLPQSDRGSSFITSAAVVVVLGGALILIVRGWR